MYSFSNRNNNGDEVKGSSMDTMKIFISKLVCLTTRRVKKLQIMSENKEIKLKIALQLKRTY